MLDLEAENRPMSLEEVRQMQGMKTGALIQASVAMGGMVAETRLEFQEALEVYGRSVGLAFQLADDVLDADEDAGDDGPPSYVKLLGIDETRRRAWSLVEDALSAIRPLPRPERLEQLAKFIVERDV